jgi:hypothetical protein
MAWIFQIVAGKENIELVLVYRNALLNNVIDDL